MLGRGPRRGADGALAKTSRSWAGRVASLFGGPDLGDELWDGLEEALLGADLGVPTTFELLDRLRARVSRERIREPGEALAALRSEVAAMLRSGGEVEDLDGLLYPGDGERPLVVLVVGVNGVGKTTTIAKLAHMYRSAGAGVVLGAADTFRAAAIEQLQAWGEALGVRVVAHGAGADPGAVAFDAVRAARAAGADVAIVDTAGRMHTRSNLMEELRKILRVVRRAEAGLVRVVMVVDAATGQNGLQQARSFVEAVGCDGVVLAKLDGTSKGGVVLAIVSELGLPILFVGTGEGLEDLAPFEAAAFADALLSAPRA